MNIIVCVDNSMGMLFNNRRQSKDIAVTDKIKNLTQGSHLWINEFSRSLFLEFEADRLTVDNDFLLKAKSTDYCFVENCTLKEYDEKIEKLLVFKWNRDYPYDFSFDIDLSECKLNSTEDFVGNSHEKITLEVYSK